MINITAAGTEIYGKLDTKLTSGTVGRKVTFTFDYKWDGLIKTAIFRVGDNMLSQYLEYSNECDFPWELLVKENIGQLIHIGVCGVRDGEVVYPTMYTYLGVLEEGADISADPSVEHSPELVEQLLLVATEAKEIAESVREDIDNGNFNTGGNEGGVAGRGVSKTEIDDNGNLIIYYTDKTSQNLGYVIGPGGPQGPKGDKGDKGDTGEQGPKGETGETGPQGNAGVDGKTPEKGTDYWTPADKQEMVNDVLAALPVWVGGSY